MASKEFGKYLKELRKSKNITVKALADLSGVSQSYLTNVENNKRGVPSPDILKKLERPLGVPFKELMVKAGHIPESEVIRTPSPGAFDDHIRSFIHLLIRDREHPFFGRINGELSERIEELFTKHNVKSTKKVTISDKNGVRDDIPDQYADMIIDIDNAQFKWDVLQELQDIAHEYHLRFNPTYELGIRKPQAQKLEHIIEHEHITYNGHQVTDQDKQLITVYLDTLFRDRISSMK